ncbi:MAG: HlyD family secretion protein [Paraburkholderia sp.]|nr:MAG: HlyD family secretion protein [Paraburkholderia sp.]
MSTTIDARPRGSTQQEAGANGPRRARNRRWLIGLLLVALVAGVAWFVHWWTVDRFIESTDDAYLKADNVTVAPKISGYITQVFVRDNETVAAGAPLVRLDTRQYEASLAQAQATVAAREADLARAQADLKQQQAAVVQAQAQEEVARVAARHAQDDVARYTPLAATGAETGERLASLVSTRDQARATLAANAAEVRSAQTQIDATSAQIAQARAQVEAARASLRQAQLDVNDTTLYSSIAGRIGDRSVRVGQYVQPGTRLLTVVPVQSLYLEANFKETQIGRMRPGEPATLHVDALRGVDLHGVVDSFAPGTGSQFALLPPENATGNFTKIVQRVPVRIRVQADAQTRSVLLPGLSVTVDIDTRGAAPKDRPLAAGSNHG